MSDTLDPDLESIIQETQESVPAGHSKIDDDFGVQVTETPEIKPAAAVNNVKKTDSNKNPLDVDLSVRGFNPITKYFEDTPNPVFDDPAYYKTCLTGEGESAQRLHQLLVKYLNCTDKKDRTIYRQQMVAAYWEFLKTMAPKMINPKLPLCKRMAMRFGVVLPSLFTPEQKAFFAKSILNNITGEPVLYIDEWMKEIGAGRLTASATDEVATRPRGPGAEQQRILQLKSKNNGKLQSTENLVNAKEGERKVVENEVRERVNELMQHPVFIGLEPHTEPYSEQQRRLFAEITARFHTLQKIDRELTKYLKDFQDAKEIEENLESKAAELPEETASVGKEEIVAEMGSVRQMAKMTCGRQGNQFPVFTKEFFHCFEKSTGFRENVIRELAWIESIDPGCFTRIHKNIPHRIVPYVLLVPTYGDMGFCWEPFDRFNRITSRGRIVVPMYPRDLKIACLTAVADLRWQVAKEKASFDWMTEGLTGNYYQYIDSKKLKGDIKQFFIEDYILWMTKEANGSQKMEKEVRGIFWRYVPFPQSLKEELKKRSLTYQELYQRDVNRSMSDGY